MAALVLRFKVRLVRDRVVVDFGDVPQILGRVVRCPCCGCAVDFREA